MTNRSIISRIAAARPMSISSMRLPIRPVLRPTAKTPGNYRERRSRAGDLHNQRKKEALLRLRDRGAPDGPDDGSIAPWAVAASLPFAPDIVQPALTHFETLKLRQNNAYGFKATFNATMADRSGPSKLWISPFHFAINQGPIS